MMIKDEWKSSSGASVGVYNYSFNVVEKFPYSAINVRLVFNNDNGKIKINNQGKLMDKGTVLLIYPISITLKIFNISARGEMEFKTDYRIHNDVIISVPLSIDFLYYIESKRTGDLKITIKFDFAYRDTVDINSDDQIYGGMASLQFIEDFSAAKWTQLLTDIGYSEKWIIEIDRPKIEGFTEVIEHIKKAQEALFNKNDPEDVIRDLRVAKDSFKSYYDSRKSEIAKSIDIGSQGEPNRAQKSQRIEEMYAKVCEFINIGPHNDKYRVTYSDALLAYREFISLLSYLGGIISDIQRDEK